MFRRGKPRQRIFIFPTLYGFIYGGGALVCLLCGMAYLNNLAYLLCFFLISLFIIGMHQSNNNLKDISIEKLEIPVVPAHQRSVGQLWVKSESGMEHSSLGISAPLWDKGNKEGQLNGKIPSLKARSQNIFTVNVQTGNRGEKKVRRIKLFSRFPFGLFYVWRYYTLDQAVFVHPKPLANNIPPTFLKKGQEVHQPDSLSGHDFKEHRLYQIGESQKHIDWKAYARGRPLMVKKFEEGVDGHFHLSAEKTTPHFEERLGQLAHWIFHCEKNQLPYSLEVPQFELPQGAGYRHRIQSLKALALTGLSNS